MPEGLIDFKADSAYTEVSFGDALLCEIHLQRNTGVVIDESTRAAPCFFD